MLKTISSLAIFSIAVQASAAPLFQLDEPSVNELLQAAGQQIQAQEYEAAADTLRQAVETDDTNPLAWQLLGFSLHMSGDLDEAIKAHAKASTFDQTRGISLYNLGCAYTLKSDADKAFDYLNQAVAANFRQVSQFETDSDLDAIRDDVRFTRLMDRVRGEDVTDDFTADGLIGTWIVVKETAAGEENDDHAETIVIESETFSVTGPAAEAGDFPYSLDVSRKTPTMEFENTTAILSMKGDQLTVCYEFGNSEAPAGFESTSGNGKTLAVLRRAVDPGQLTGTWTYVSGTRAGDTVGEDRLAGEVTLTADRITLPASPTEVFVMKYELSVVEGLSAIDMSIESGPVPEGTAVGIVKVDGDELTLCYNAMGGDRPTEFNSTSDNGHFMFVLRRATDASGESVEE